MPKLRENHKKIPQSEPKAEANSVEEILESGQDKVVEENMSIHDLSIASHGNVVAPDREEKSVYDLSVSTGPRKKTVTIGEYEFSLPEEKIPLLAVMGCAIILFISIFIDETIYASRFKYGIFLSIFAFFGALVSVAIPTEKTIPLNYLIYILTYIGAILATMEFGPFSEPGNGYFASWGLVISSAIAADPPGSIKRAHFNTMLNVVAAALVFIISSLPKIIDGTDYENEVYCAVSFAGLLFLMSSIVLLSSFSTRGTRAIACFTSIAFTVVASAWLIIASVVTFKGPFTETGNGYFSAWFAVIMSVKAAILEWRKHVLNKRSGGSSQKEESEEK